MSEMIISAVFALIVGVMVFLAYRQGLKDGRAIESKQAIKPLFNTKPKVDTAKSEDDALLEWAESYKG